MIKLKEAVIVEGKYDQIKLSSLVDALIIPTNGFRIFKDRGKMKLIRKLAEQTGIIVLTDSDAAGFMIRAKLSSSIAPEQIKHAYIPDILGKEKRKRVGSKEGKLGVEGMQAKVLRDALKRAGAVIDGEHSESPSRPEPVTRLDFYEAGLTGAADSGERRQKLLLHLNLPEKMPSQALYKLLGKLMSREEFWDMAGKLFPNEGEENS